MKNPETDSQSNDKGTKVIQLRKDSFSTNGTSATEYSQPKYLDLSQTLRKN